MKLTVIILMMISINTFSSIKIEGLDLRVNKKTNVKLKKDKPTVYYFLSAWCPCSQGTFDHLNTLQKKYKDFNFVGFHSSVAIPESAALKYFSKFKIDFPIINDPNVKYADHFKAMKTPHVFVYSKDDKLLYQGAATNSKDSSKATEFYLDKALLNISKGKAPKEAHVKAIGCYIQRDE